MRATVTIAVAALVLLLAQPEAHAPATRVTHPVREAGRPAAAASEGGPAPGRLVAHTASSRGLQSSEPQSPEPTATSGTVDPAGLAALRAMPRVIVLDPGHGGLDFGVRGRGSPEKAIALDTARRLKALVEGRIGARVVLTRDDDLDVAFDARTAIANVSRPDLFLSLHLNASPSSDASGTLVYSQRLGPEGEQARVDATRNAFAVPVQGGGTRTVEMLSWEFAQARHIDRSARLAQALAAALAAEPSMRSAAARQAPLRMLAGVNAPAAMVELAYLTNASQDSLASSDEFINGAAEALLNGIAQFLLQPVDTGRR